MTDMTEPSPESPGPRPSDVPTGAKPSGPAAPASRSKGPPQDPEAFQRWIGIERLKVDMRRLELETKRMEAPETMPPRRRSPVLPILYGVILVALVGLTAFLASQVLALRGEIGALRTAQTEIGQRLAAAESEQTGLREAVEAAQTKANAAASVQPAPQASSQTPAAPSVAPADASSQAAAPAAPDPALPGSGYTVRIFAPVNAVAKAKIDGFVNPLKAAGYDVVVSDTGVVQTTSNSLSYHASSEEMAKRLSTLIQQKKPALAMEMRASPSIPPSARQILILNLTEDAFK
ncbi:hypothetical protein Snov_0432 [Ancylobacter novellus DSM 506]|uniref:Uncharacterized protein n=1 Tax=Ancylobacter novellus (strain ATCC 8093 / DSM 506 / JCM 20403 / CCM 1077 / IAM 12100 / NBRC 12443 / NCIMB 10456) TaxID=639283 RepID=D7A347_ANCN5|nr:hypothetical protein [Ancylobacter novellus]ADH87765.1 hypothetical protein Snov_0432 [Ancylobacter novellus DSM 506]